MATLEELKRKAKAAALAVTLGAVPTAAVATDGKDVPPADVRTEMNADAAHAQLIVENAETYLDLKNETAARLSEQFNLPVTEENKKYSPEKTYIGPFLGVMFLDDMLDKEKYKSNFSSPKSEMDRPVREINSREDYNQLDNLAYFDHSDKQVHIPQYVLSPDMAAIIKEKMGNTWTGEILLGNPAALIATKNHEDTHFLHNIRGQTDEDRLSFQTPDMLVERDYCTEKLAFSVQCLTLANIYTQCKDAGIETLQINGEERPLGSILEVVPGLRETVEQNGFDPKSEESLGNVIKLASAQWDEDYWNGYAYNHFVDTAEGGSCSGIMNQIQASRDQKKILTDMTKSLGIGYGMKIDIPEDCIPLMMPKTELTQSVTDFKAFSPCTEGLLAIDSYLDSLGLKNDKAKDEYLKTQYVNIVNRAPEADQELKKLLLDCSNPGASRNQTIYYTDGLKAVDYGSFLTISEDNGKTTYPVSRMDKELDNLQAQRQSSNEAEQSNSFREGRTAVLTPAQITAALRNETAR